MWKSQSHFRISLQMSKGRTVNWNHTPFLEYKSYLSNRNMMLSTASMRLSLPKHPVCGFAGCIVYMLLDQMEPVLLVKTHRTPVLFIDLKG